MLRWAVVVILLACAGCGPSLKQLQSELREEREELDRLRREKAFASEEKAKSIQFLVDAAEKMRDSPPATEEGIKKQSEVDNELFELKLMHTKQIEEEFGPKIKAQESRVKAAEEAARNLNSGHVD